MKYLLTTVSILVILVLVAVPVLADYPNGYADFCFEQTLKAGEGAAPADLTTKDCQRALRTQPMGINARSVVIHNRGIIQQAKGETDAALASFRTAVRLSRTVDMRNVALGRLAHKLGEYELALEQYNLVLDQAADSIDANTMSAVRQQRGKLLDTMLAGGAPKTD